LTVIPPPVEKWFLRAWRHCKCAWSATSNQKIYK